MKVQSSQYTVNSKQGRPKNLTTDYCLLSTNKKGFTLIELVITMVLIGIVAYVVASALSTGIKAYFVTDFRKEALDQARIAMERVTREIRNVVNNQSICTATANSIGFYGITDDAASPIKLIEFQLSGTTDIQRRENAGTWYNLSSGNPITLTLSYYGTNGNPLPFPNVGCTTPPTITDIKRIKVDISVTISGESVTLQSEVWPRNL